MTDDPEPSRSGVRTLFFGSGAFAVPILEALIEAPEADVVAVITAPDRAAGRHGPLTSVPVAAAARKRGVPVLQPSSLRSPETVGQLARLAPALGVLADYGRIVPPDVLALPAHGILNVHPSLLPRHRGAAPVAGSILAGDAETGVTLIRMDAGVDTGPIVAATSWRLDGTETAPQVEQLAAAEGGVLLRATLAPWLRGEIEPRAQEDDAATMTRPLRRSDGRLDPARPVAELERQVRAYQPWPGSWLETVVGRVVIWRTEAVPGFDTGDVPAGRFGRFGLHASDGHLALREVQPAGGRRMTWDELVRGRPAIVGSDVVAPD